MMMYNKVYTDKGGVMYKASTFVLAVLFFLLVLSHGSVTSKLAEANGVIAQHEVERAASAMLIVELERKQKEESERAGERMQQWRDKYEQEKEDNANNDTLNRAVIGRLREQANTNSSRCDAVQADTTAGVDDDKAPSVAWIDAEIKRAVADGEKLYSQCAHMLRAFQSIYE